MTARTIVVEHLVDAGRHLDALRGSLTDALDAAGQIGRPDGGLLVQAIREARAEFNAPSVDEALEGLLKAAALAIPGRDAGE